MTDVLNGDELHYRTALRRIYLHTVVVAAAGAVFAFWQWGVAAGVGFLVGASISAVNFRWLHRLVDSLGPQPETQPAKKPRRVSAVFLGSRYLVFGLAGYVIVRYFKISIMAALVGLFVAVAAVLIEILYELVYART